MTDRITDHISRRNVLKTIAVSGTAGVAGCLGETDSGNSGGNTPTADPTEVPSLDAGIKEWGERLNSHARDASIDWEQFRGDDIELTFGMGLHPYSTTFSREASDGTQVKDYFEELTGITVNYEIVSEDQFWLETEEALSSNDNPYDGFMNGLWPSGGYHYGTDGQSWARDLFQYIDDASLTDQDWLAMDDFLDQTIELMSFPNEDGTVDFIGFPNGIETYGCTGMHLPTLDAVGAPEPTDLGELREVARLISESDAVEREGIVSRTSSTTLSSANFGTLYKTFGADWVDRQTKEERVTTDTAVEALEHFGDMLHNYGPNNPGTYDWYANNNAYSEGQVGLMYSTPQTSGIVNNDIMADTKWLPPLPGPDGQNPVSDTWVWSTGISATSSNPEAAWLYIQWANSRQANLMLSTRQWAGDNPRAGYARFNYVRDQIEQGNAPGVPGQGYLDAFETGMSYVPGGDPSTPEEYPPVPVDTPQNMNIMSEVAQAMSNVVSNGPANARDELEAIGPAVTEFAQRIPDYYVADDRFLDR